MFFVLSKTLGVLINPINFFIAAILFCAIIYWFGFHKPARNLGILIALTFLLCAYTQFPDFLLQRLETTQDETVLAANEGKISGIIVLGGAVSVNKEKMQNWFHTNTAADRIIEGIYLANKFPDLPIIYTGGNGSLISDGSIEADGFSRAVERLGGLKNRIILEKQSRNTRQNAKLTAKIIKADTTLDEQGRWLLVTSAFHMKRSAIAFRKENIAVIEWPTDFRADVLSFPWIVSRPSAQLKKLRTFLHEAVGLIAYAIVDRRP